MRPDCNTTTTRTALAAAVVLGFAIAATPAHAVLIGFEAENGNSASTTVTATLGADFTPTADANAYGGSYITSATDFIDPPTSPGAAARVVSYDVDFAEAGDYDLYGRLLVEVDGADDSLFIPVGLGAKSPTTAADWIVVNRVFDNGDQGIGAGVYAWVNLSQWPDFGGGAQYTVATPGAQTLQIGAREDGLWFDAFAFGTTGETFSGVDFEVAVTGALSSQWGVDGGGSFGQQGTVSANWTDGAVPSSDAVFGGFLTSGNAPATVTLDFPVSLDSVTFNNANDYILAGPETLTLTGVAKVDTQLGRHWLMTEVAGSGGLNASGGGELVLTADNSFTGDVTIDNTNLAITNPDALPAGNNVALTNGAQLRFWGSDNAFFGDGVANGTGVATGLDPNSNLNVGGDISVDASSTVDVNSGANVTLSGVISGAGAVAVNSGATVALTNASNSYFGVTNVNGGSLTISNATALGSADGSPGTQTFVAGGSSDGVLELTGGVTVTNELLDLSAREGAGIDNVHVTSDGNNTWAGNIKGTAGGTNYNIESTSGTLTLSGTISAPDENPRNYVFSGAGDFNITGTLVDAVTTAGGDFDLISSVDNVTVTKRGAGVLSVSTQTDLNDDYWFGGATVEEGTLAVISDGSNNGELRSTVTVNAGATFDVSSFSSYNLLPTQNAGEVGLMGGGTVDGGGTTTVGAFESTTIAPGDSVGTLTIDGNFSLTYFDAGEATVRNVGSLNFELGDTAATVGGAENDLIDVSGSVTVTAPSANEKFVVNVTPSEAGFDTSTPYTLITAGSLSASASNFTANITGADGNPLVTRYTPSVTVGASSLNLSVTGAAQSRTWDGDVSNEWGIATANNWQEGDQQYRDLDHVTFDDTADGVGDVVVQVDGARLPGSVTFANGSRDYTIAGDGGITGSGAVDVTGSAEVTLANNGNNYAGVTTVSSGSLLRYAADATTGDISNAGTLVVGNASATVDPVAIVNGDFDSDPDDTAPPTGWTDLSSATSFWVGVADEPGNLAGEFAAEAGFINNFLSTARLSAGVGSQPVDGTLVQTIDLSSFGAEIDSGARQLFVDFDWASGDERDSANFSLAFFSSTDGSGAELGAGFSEALDEADGFGIVSFHESFGGPVPVGARSVTLQIETTRTGGSETNVWLDNIAGVIGDGVNTSADLQVSGDLTLVAGSTLELIIQSTTTHSEVFVDGMLTADGVLKLTELGAPVFSQGDVLDLFDFASVSGTFDSLDLPTLAAGLSWDDSNLYVTGELAVVSLANAGDFNGDGVVDSIDYAVWRENLGNSADTINNAGSGGALVVEADFQVWLDNYGADYSPASGPTPAPEPGAALLLLFAATTVGGAARRRRMA